MRISGKRRVFGLLLLLAGLSLVGSAAEQGTASGVAIKLTVEDVIGPATADYINRALDTAAERQAKLVILQMDTPGGLDTAMRSIIKHITNSPVPVATYVAPTGSRAASAGTYILYASHIAAMAPGTNLGAATPVQIGGGGSSPVKAPEQGKSDGEGDLPPIKPINDSDAMKAKVTNDAVAYIRGLAKLRGRNAEWAEQAVREAASLPADEALAKNVIDVIAENVTDLLQKIDGRTVLVQGVEQTLHTAGLDVETSDPDWRTRLLSIITNPNIAYILMLVGIYGLILEFSNPGAIVPGTVGAISLLLALYSFQLLPINYAGIALILLGVALMVGEAFQPSFGMLGIGGLTAFVIGSVILMDTRVPGFGIDLSVIITFAVISALVFIVVVGLAIRARRRPVVSGREELVGAEAVVLQDFQDTGTVNIHSEIWTAHTHIPLKKGQTVHVTRIHGLTLEVEPLAPPSQETTT